MQYLLSVSVTQKINITLTLLYRQSLKCIEFFNNEISERIYIVIIYKRS
jgi:hypothetical protein